MRLTKKQVLVAAWILAFVVSPIILAKIFRYYNPAPEQNDIWTPPNLTVKLNHSAKYQEQIPKTHNLPQHIP